MAFAHTAKARTRKRSGKLKKWRPTISHLGTRAEKQMQKTAKCYASRTTELSLGNNMGMKERYWEATTKAANEITKPWYKKAEFWIGIIANVIALGALIVAITALKK